MNVNTWLASLMIALKFWRSSVEKKQEITGKGNVIISNTNGSTGYLGHIFMGIVGFIFCVVLFFVFREKILNFFEKASVVTTENENADTVTFRVIAANPDNTGSYCESVAMSDNLAEAKLQALRQAAEHLRVSVSSLSVIKEGKIVLDQILAKSQVASMFITKIQYCQKSGIYRVTLNIYVSNVKSQHDNERLEKKNASLTSENARLTSENARLTSENASLTSTNWKLATNNNELIAENQAFKKIRNDASQKIPLMLMKRPKTKDFEEND